MQETEIKFDISSNKGGTFPIPCKNIHWFKRSEKEWKRQSSQQVRKWITTGLFEGKNFPAMVTFFSFNFKRKNCLLNIFPVGKGIFFETWLAHLREAIKRITPTYCWAEILKQGTPLQIQTKDMVQEKNLWPDKREFNIWLKTLDRLHHLMLSWLVVKSESETILLLINDISGGCH